jgi:hypothetical protein
VLLSRHVFDVPPELPKYHLDFFVLVDCHHRFALQLDQAGEAPCLQNDDVEYCLY